MKNIDEKKFYNYLTIITFTLGFIWVLFFLNEACHDAVYRKEIEHQKEIYELNIFLYKHKKDYDNLKTEKYSPNLEYEVTEYTEGGKLVRINSKEDGKYYFVKFYIKKDGKIDSIEVIFDNKST